jgi:putative membrane protein
MRAALFRLGLIGAVIGIAWWMRDGFGDVGGALDNAGWGGVAILVAYHLIPMTLCGLGWAAVQAPPRYPAWIFISGRWIRDGVGELAGFLPLSGEVAGIRHLTRFGLRPAVAGATVVVDVTAEAIAQFFFSLIGVGLWAWLYPESEVTRWGLIALAISVPVLIGLVMVQRSWFMNFIETLPSKLMPKTWDAPDQEQGVLVSIHEIYGRRRRVALSVGWHILAWIAGAGEAWVALHLLGVPLDFPNVLALESIIFAIRSIAFVIPGALGVQEGGYMLIGTVLGLPTETALALSLMKRGRELILGLTALIAWHFIEGATAKKR